MQVALVRDEADASCAAPRLTLEEKAAIAERHAKKQAEAQKRGIAVMLRDIMGHKVSVSLSSIVWDLTYDCKHNAVALSRRQSPAGLLKGQMMTLIYLIKMPRSVST